MSCESKNAGERWSMKRGIEKGDGGRMYRQNGSERETREGKRDDEERTKRKKRDVIKGGGRLESSRPVSEEEDYWETTTYTRAKMERKHKEVEI